MTTRVLKTETGREALIKLIEKRPLPITVNIAKGANRSVEQNRLQRRLLNEIAEQTGQTAEEVRALCKLTIGVPILRAGSADFAEKYDRIIRPHSYEEKIAMMMEPFDFPVTRLMKTKQKTQYLEELMRTFAEQGVVFSGLLDANEGRAA